MRAIKDRWASFVGRSYINLQKPYLFSLQIGDIRHHSLHIFTQVFLRKIQAALNDSFKFFWIVAILMFRYNLKVNRGMKRQNNTVVPFDVPLTEQFPRVLGHISADAWITANPTCGQFEFFIGDVDGVGMGQC